MAAKLKAYTVRSKSEAGALRTIEVHARSKTEAQRIAEKRHNYKGYGFTVKGPY